MTGPLLAGAILFAVGRVLKPRSARKVWFACGLAYLAAAGASRARPAASLEAALGASFIGAGYALERLERLDGPTRP